MRRWIAAAIGRRQKGCGNFDETWPENGHFCLRMRVGLIGVP
jgi:hypothetical protein